MIKTFASSRQQYQWQYQDREFTVAYETLGEGPPVLLLPALSTVSTRQEMLGLAQVLASEFQVVMLDWLGFGESDRPNLNYARHSRQTPSLYEQLVRDFVQAKFQEPVSLVGAGHGATYAMRVAQNTPSVVSKLLLIAPTWKGPLRIMGLPGLITAGIRNLVRLPIVGQTLYALNTTPAFLKFMYRQHVYTNANLLTPEFMAEKRRITQQPGARFAPAAFVTGGLDPMTSRKEFLDVARSLTVPTKVVIGEQSPRGSRAEMEALADLPNINSSQIPGSLGMHEEYASPVGKIAKSFLRET